MAIIVEAMLGTIFEAAAWFVCRCLRPVCGPLFFYTGELTLKVVTLGRHRLQSYPYQSVPNPANSRRSSALGGLVWLGLLLWSLIAFFGLHIG